MVLLAFRSRDRSWVVGGGLTKPPSPIETAVAHLLRPLDSLVSNESAGLQKGLNGDLWGREVREGKRKLIRVTLEVDGGKGETLMFEGEEH